jgi:transposase-like protein
LNHYTHIWNCPHCKTTNVHDFFLDERPQCWGCRREFRWSELLTVEEHTEARRQLREHAQDILRRWQPVRR